MSNTKLKELIELSRIVFTKHKQERKKLKKYMQTKGIKSNLIPVSSSTRTFLTLFKMIEFFYNHIDHVISFLEKKKENKMAIELKKLLKEEDMSNILKMTFTIGLKFKKCIVISQRSSYSLHLVKLFYDITEKLFDNAIKETKHMLLLKSLRAGKKKLNKHWRSFSKETRDLFNIAFYLNTKYCHKIEAKKFTNIIPSSITNLLELNLEDLQEDFRKFQNNNNGNYNEKFWSSTKSMSFPNLRKLGKKTKIFPKKITN